MKSKLCLEIEVCYSKWISNFTWRLDFKMKVARFWVFSFTRGVKNRSKFYEQYICGGTNKGSQNERKGPTLMLQSFRMVHFFIFQLGHKFNAFLNSGWSKVLTILPVFTLILTLAKKILLLFSPLDWKQLSPGLGAIWFFTISRWPHDIKWTSFLDFFWMSQLCTFSLQPAYRWVIPETLSVRCLTLS